MGQSPESNVRPGVRLSAALGIVDADYRIEVWNNRQNTGYRADDCDMNGFTKVNDRALTWVNRQRGTGVSR